MSDVVETLPYAQRAAAHKAALVEHMLGLQASPVSHDAVATLLSLGSTGCVSGSCASADPEPEADSDEAGASLGSNNSSVGGTTAHGSLSSRTLKKLRFFDCYLDNTVAQALSTGAYGQSTFPAPIFPFILS